MAHDSEWVQHLFDDVRQSKFWSSLRYGITSTSYSSHVDVLIGCKLMDIIGSDLTHLPVGKIERIDISVQLFTLCKTITFDCFSEMFSYLFTTLMLNLEYSYPFAFSHYGRNLLHANYAAMVRTYSLILTSYETNEAPDQNDILLKVLTRLKAVILHEFNTLNVMMECDVTKSARRSIAKSARGNGKNSFTKTFKRLAIHLTLF